MAKLEKFNMRQVLDHVKKEMIELTSLPFNTIVGVAQDEETHVPTVTIELVERKAIPDSMDLLGVYECILDNECKVQTFKRVGMRKRCDISAAGDF